MERSTAKRWLDPLPDDLVIKILAFSDEDARVKVLPFVSRRIWRLLREPSVCWQRLVFKSRRGDVEWMAEHTRLLGFLDWAVPRAGGLHSGPVVAALHGLLEEAATPSLQVLEIKAAFLLRMRYLLPPQTLQRMKNLRELELLTEEGLEDLQLGSATALQRLNLVDDSDMPRWRGAPADLPPSLTWLGLTPAPMMNLPNGAAVSFLPPCVLGLPALQFLDVSESFSLVGLDEALPGLTALTGLALDHTTLRDLPPQLSLLTRLRLLSLHGALAPHMEQAPSFAPLAALHELRVLSISECTHLRALPAAVAGLTNLKALHVEKCPELLELPQDINLPRCQMLSVDWRVLTHSHHVLPRLLKLQQLLLGNMWWDGEQPQAADHRPPRSAEEIAKSLSRCTALRRITVLVYDEVLSVGVAALMLALPRLCPSSLQLEAISANEFFLTDSESLAREG